MRKFWLIGFLAGLLASLAAGQQTPTPPSNFSTQQLTLVTQNPIAAPLPVTITPSVAGSTTYYYWIVTHSGSETSAPAGPYLISNAPATLGGIYSDSIAWTPIVSGATYDLLRTTTTTVPAAACGCAVGTGLASFSFTDGLSSTTSYTVNTSADQASLACTNVTGCGISAPPLSSGVQYVSPIGNDANTGTFPDAAHAKASPQGALNALPSGGTIHVAAGTYAVNSGLSVPSAPIEFVCDDGPAATVINFTFSTGDAFSPWYGSKIHGCSFIGPYVGGSLGQGINGGAAVWAASTNYSTANNNVAPTYANANGHVYEETVASCTSGSTEPSWPITPGGTIGDNTCTWKEEGPIGVELYGNRIGGFGGQQVNIGGGSGWWDIHDNTFIGGAGSGVSSFAEDILIGQNAQKVRVHHNLFTNSPRNAVDINGAKNVVTGNVMYKSGYPGGSSVDFQCVTMVSLSTGTQEVSDNVISDNVCDQPGGPGILIQGQNNAPGMNRNHIVGNSILAPQGAGSNGDCISIDGGTSNTTSYDGTEIIGNTCLNPERWGISVHAGTATLSNTRVIGNVVKGSGSGDLDLFGATNTIVAENQFESATPLSTSGGSALWGLNFPGPEPSISSGFGTSPSILQKSGPQQFEVNVGTGGTATSGVIGLPPAPNGWSCQAVDMSTNIVTRETAFTGSTITLTAASAWTASDKLLVNCGSF